MSSLTIEIPREYGYVVLAAGSSMLVGFWHGTRTGQYRKAAKIPYPNAYASHEAAQKDKAAWSFNAAQRAHANYIENLPGFLAALLISGVRYPVPAASLGALWLVSRVLYAVGYTNESWGKGGTGRKKGGVSWLAQLGLCFLTGWTGYKMLTAQ